MCYIWTNINIIGSGMSIIKPILAAVIISCCRSAAAEEVEQAEKIDPVEATGVYTPPPELISGVSIAEELLARQLATKKIGELLDNAPRWRPIRINAQAFSAVPDVISERTSDTGPPVGNALSVILFPGETVELNNTAIDEVNADTFTWHGESEDESVQAYFTVSGSNDVRGFIRITDGPNYRITKVGGTAFHVISETDPTALVNKEF